MTLISQIVPHDSGDVGDIEWTMIAIGGGTGALPTVLTEPETGWLLGNGAACPSAAPYDKLYAYLNALGYGGNLPVLVNFRAPIAKGPSFYGTENVQGGTDQVALGAVNAPPHVHAVGSIWFPVGPSDGSGNTCCCFQTGNFQFPPKRNVDYYWQVGDYSSGGGYHENTPPYFTVEAGLIRYL